MPLVAAVRMMCGAWLNYALKKTIPKQNSRDKTLVFDVMVKNHHLVGQQTNKQN